jgi:thiamine biosynthesis lipoprotein
MGTTWAVTLNAPDLSSEERAQARAAIQASLDAVDDAMSTWDEASELARFNARRETSPFPLSDETLAVLRLAAEVSAASGGAFDPTVRPLVAAWGFGADARVPGQGPDARELAALRARIGFARLELDFAGGTARKRNPELELDLSSIAKGFGVDQAARAIEGLGHANFLVEVGGEVRARGERIGGGSWRLAVERPEPEGRAVFAVIELSDQSLATSGDYRSFYQAGGRRLSHIIDPRTAQPVAHDLASVSVVAPSAALADAWATALMVLGPEAGFTLAESLGLAAYFIARTPSGAYATRATASFPPLESAESARPESGAAPGDPVP